MDWQLVVIASVILAALLYVVRSFWNTIAGKKSCGGGCGKGCASAAPPAPRLVSEDELTARLRSR